MLTLIHETEFQISFQTGSYGLPVCLVCFPSNRRCPSLSPALLWRQADCTRKTEVISFALGTTRSAIPCVSHRYGRRLLEIPTLVFTSTMEKHWWSGRTGTKTRKERKELKHECYWIESEESSSHSVRMYTFRILLLNRVRKVATTWGERMVAKRLFWHVITGSRKDALRPFALLMWLRPFARV